MSTTLLTWMTGPDPSFHLRLELETKCISSPSVTSPFPNQECVYTYKLKTLNHARVVINTSPPLICNTTSILGDITNIDHKLPSLTLNSIPIPNPSSTFASEKDADGVTGYPRLQCHPIVDFSSTYPCTSTVQVHMKR